MSSNNWNDQFGIWLATNNWLVYSETNFEACQILKCFVVSIKLHITNNLILIMKLEIFWGLSIMQIMDNSELFLKIKTTLIIKHCVIKLIYEKNKSLWISTSFVIKLKNCYKTKKFFKIHFLTLDSLISDKHCAFYKIILYCIE